MDNETKNILESANALSATVNQRDLMLWEKEASAKSIKEATEKLDHEIEQIRKHLAKTNAEITATEVDIQRLEFSVDVVKKSREIDLYSLINQKLYKVTLAKQLEDHNKQASQIINKYDDFYKEKELSLQEKDPSYKQWKEKQIENKKILFNINNLRRKIEIQNRWIILKRSVTQKIFYNNFITFAKKCLAQQEYFKLLRELKESKKEQQITLKQLLNAQEMVKARRSRAYFLKPALPVSKVGNENKNSKIIDQCKKEIIENTPPKTSEKYSDTLLNVSRCHKNFQMEKLSSILNQNDAPTETLIKQFTADKNKVRILEQVVVPAPVPLKVAKASVQSKSQEIATKLKHCMKRISSSLSQGTTSSQKCHTGKSSQNNHSSKMEAALNASLDDECKQIRHQESDISEKFAPTTNIQSQALPSLPESSVTKVFHEKRDDKHETKNSQVNKVFETKQNTSIFDSKSVDAKHIQENMEEHIKEPVNTLPVYSSFFKHPKTVENSVINKDAHVRTANMQQENEQNMFNMSSQQMYNFGNSAFGGNFQFDANISADICDYSSLRSPVFETNYDEEDINAPAFGNFATETDNNKPQFTFGQSKNLFSLF